MKYVQTSVGPFPERPHFSDDEIETICTDELLAVDLLPAKPEPIRIDRFIEKKFGISEEYEDLGEGILGMTQFGPSGVARIIVARSLEAQSGEVANLQIRTTLAHEAGHGLLHAFMFVCSEQQRLFGNISDPVTPKVLCRARAVTSTSRQYTGEWWEFQANRVMGALLMPRDLVIVALKKYLVLNGSLGTVSVNRFSSEEAALVLADIFNVNPAVSRIRLKILFPTDSPNQMWL
jgi:hypothetical protein